MRKGLRTVSVFFPDQQLVSNFIQRGVKKPFPKTEELFLVPQ